MSDEKKPILRTTGGVTVRVTVHEKPEPRSEPPRRREIETFTEFEQLSWVEDQEHNCAYAWVNDDDEIVRRVYIPSSAPSYWRACLDWLKSDDRTQQDLLLCGRKVSERGAPDARDSFYDVWQPEFEAELATDGECAHHDEGNFRVVPIEGHQLVYRYLYRAFTGRWFVVTFNGERWYELGPDKCAWIHAGPFVDRDEAWQRVEDGPDGPMRSELAEVLKVDAAQVDELLAWIHERQQRLYSVTIARHRERLMWSADPDHFDNIYPPIPVVATLDVDRWMSSRLLKAAIYNSAKYGGYRICTGWDELPRPSQLEAHLKEVRKQEET